MVHTRSFHPVLLIYHILFIDYFQIIAHYGGETMENLNYRYYILMVLLPMLAICSIRSLRYLSPCSVIANAVSLVECKKISWTSIDWWVIFFRLNSSDWALSSTTSSATLYLTRHQCLGWRNPAACLCSLARPFLPLREFLSCCPLKTKWNIRKICWDGMESWWLRWAWWWLSTWAWVSMAISSLAKALPALLV